jgi:hypothetical protein
MDLSAVLTESNLPELAKVIEPERPILGSRLASYQRVEKFLPTSEPKIDIAVILAVIHSEKIMHSLKNFFKEFDYVRTRLLLF